MKDVSSYSPEILNMYYTGVDLFVQKKYEEAIREWEKILEIDPYNKLAIRNIKEAEDRLKRLKELGAGE
jgi:cytochrome c-type biogenesis protein CcmH/NrfG